MAIEVSWLTMDEAIFILNQWGYPHYVPLLAEAKVGGAYDDEILTRILIVRFESDDTVRFVAYAERNPTSDLIDALEAAREFYGHTPKKLIAICHDQTNLNRLQYLINNHPDAPGHTNEANKPSGDKVISYRRD